MITKTKDFTCYNSYFTAIISNHDVINLRKKMISVDNQLYPACEKIVIFQPNEDPEWFIQYQDWNYAYTTITNNENLLEYARELVSTPWFFIVTRDLPNVALLRIAEQMSSIYIVESRSVFEWEGVKVHKK